MSNTKSNWKDRLTFSNVKEEAINALCVTGGLIGASLFDRLVQKGVEKFLPSALPYVGPIKSGLTALGGLVISTLADSGKEKLKLVGYGVTGAGVLSGLRLIPQIDTLFSGFSGVLGSTLDQRLLGVNIGDFGAAENVKKISTAEAEESTIDLPDLGGSQRYETASGEPVIDTDFEELTLEMI